MTFLQFVPLEDEILDFFRPVSSSILQTLKAKECLPVQTSKKGTTFSKTERFLLRSRKAIEPSCVITVLMYDWVENSH